MNQKIRNYRDLIAWQEGHRLVLATYEATKSFPSNENFGLISQMRRAAVSVTSCLAEGFSRKSNKDKLNFYKMATGSLTELDNQIIISRDLKYLDTKKYGELSQQLEITGRLLSGLCRATRESKYRDYPND